MFELSLVGLLALAISASAQMPQLPPGAMQKKTTTACTECHSAEIILQQRLGKAAWAKEVDKMTRWGAFVDPKDKDAIIEYLSSNFPAEKGPYSPRRTAAGRGRRDRPIARGTGHP